MAKSLLQRFLGRDEVGGVQEAFQLPGTLHESVRLLLIDSGHLTDLLFAIPFVEKLKEQCPDARVGLICDERTSHLALTSGLFQDLIVVSPEQMKPSSNGHRKLTELLQGEEWEVAILTGREPDPTREALARASGARLRLGPGHDQAFPNLNLELRAPIQRDYPSQRTATWGRVLGVPVEADQLRWPLAPELDRQMAQLVHFNKPRKDQLLVGIDPAVSQEGIGLAPENFAFLVNHLVSHVRCKTLLLSAGDRERCEQLKGLLRSEQLELPRPTLKETTLLLAQCDLFLAANTELLHFAAAMDVPTLGIFTDLDKNGWLPPHAGNLAILESVEGERLSLADFMDEVNHLLG